MVLDESLIASHAAHEEVFEVTFLENVVETFAGSGLPGCLSGHASSRTTLIADQA